MLTRIPGWLTVLLLAVSLQSTARAGDPCHILRSPPIAVTMIGREPVISARINGVDARFMVDTGSSFQVLYPSAAAQFKLPLKPQPGFYTVGVGGYDNPDSATVKHFGFGSIEVPNVVFLVSGNDLSQSGIAGLLGNNLFQLWDEEFDFAEGTMRLVEPQHCGGKIMAYWTTGEPVGLVDLQRTTEKTETYLIGTASVNGQSVRVLFDTGSDTSLLSLEAARRAGISPNSPGVVAAGAAEGIGGQQLVQTWIAPIAEFDIGGEEIRHTRIQIGDVHSRYDDPHEKFDMLLGADFFLAHHVYVANSQSKLYFTYSGGPVFDIRARPAPALQDLDRAIRLSPTDYQARLARAELQVPELHAGAKSDMDAVDRLAPPGANERFTLSDLYGDIGQYPLAIHQITLWIDHHPDDVRLRLALGSRCRLRAEADQDLDEALKDCNRAVGLAVADAEVLDSRGLVYLRRGALDRAIADYDAALKANPRVAAALFGRGLAELRKGDEALGHADIGSAETLAPQIADFFAGIGLTP